MINYINLVSTLQYREFIVWIIYQYISCFFQHWTLINCKTLAKDIDLIIFSIIVPLHSLLPRVFRQDNSLQVSLQVLNSDCQQAINVSVPFAAVRKISFERFRGPKSFPPQVPGATSFRGVSGRELFQDFVEHFVRYLECRKKSAKSLLMNDSMTIFQTC